MHQDVIKQAEVNQLEAEDIGVQVWRRFYSPANPETMVAICADLGIALKTGWRHLSRMRSRYATDRKEQINAVLDDAIAGSQEIREKALERFREAEDPQAAKSWADVFKSQVKWEASVCGWDQPTRLKIETDITEPDFRRALDAATPDELAQIRGPLRGDAPAQDAIVRAILQRLRVG